MYFKVAQRGFPHSSSLSWQLPCVSWSLGRHVGALMRRTARLFVSKGQAYSWEMTRMCVVRGGGGGGGAGLRAFLVNHESTQSDGWGFVSFQQLSSVLGLNSLNWPERNQTLNSLFWDFGADKTFETRWSGGRVQAWAQVQAPACHLAFTTRGFSRRQSKVLIAKSITLGAALKHSLGGLGEQAQT